MNMRERVRGLIVESGYTQGDFGRQVGIEPTKLSKSLSGTRKFTSLELASIADTCGVTVEWILTGEEDVLAAAARTGANGISADKALTRARELAGARKSLSELGIEQQWSLNRHSGFHARRWTEQGQEMALDVQQSMKTQPHETRDLAGLIEDEFRIDVAVEDLGGLDGLAIATDQARLILVSSTRPLGRQRFTLMHELAHLLASDDQQLHKDSDIHAGKGEGEVRANAFAAEMLMPRETILAWAQGESTHDNFAQLVCELMVSPAALAWRLHNLSFISPNQRDEWLKLTSADCARRASRTAEFAERAAQASEGRTPRLLFADALEAYSRQKTTLRLAARVMNTDTSTVRSLIGNTDG